AVLVEREAVMDHRMNLGHGLELAAVRVRQLDEGNEKRHFCARSCVARQERRSAAILACRLRGHGAVSGARTASPFDVALQLRARGLELRAEGARDAVGLQAKLGIGQTAKSATQSRQA